MLQLKILHATTKTQCNQKKKAAKPGYIDEDGHMTTKGDWSDVATSQGAPGTAGNHQPGEKASFKNSSRFSTREAMAGDQVSVPDWMSLSGVCENLSA